MEYFKVLDMPKLKSPFVRKTVNGVYVVTPEVEEGYEWVFTSPDVRAVEKVDGTNVSIVNVARKIVKVYNRTSEVDAWGKSPINRCILESISRDIIPKDEGQWFGEAIGYKIQGNPLNLPNMWLPYVYMWDRFSYKDWGRFQKTFINISNWLRDLHSMVSEKYGDSKIHRFAEGVVFTHTDGRMAKLRRDMFDWYEGKRH